MTADSAGTGGGAQGHRPLQIRPDGEFDLLALGGLVIRLDTGLVPFRKATECTIHVSGGEYNVAANISDCFGLRTAIATAMVDYPVGELVAERVRAMGVTGIYRHFKHDGVTGPNIATVYSDRGLGVRPPVVFYNRADEAAAMLRPGDFDWDAIFGRGVRWLHSGGLFAALSETTPEVLVEAMTAARAHGAIVSCDLNYRAKLWARLGGEARAREVMTRIAENVDVLLGGTEDIGLCLGIEQPDVPPSSNLDPHAPPSSNLDPHAFEVVTQRVVDRYPKVRLVATTLRGVNSATRHVWSAAAWADGKLHQAPTIDLDVYDRVGSGDGFASGLLYGLLAGHSVEESLRLGWAHGALLTTYPGDTTMATLAQVKALASGGSARIQR